MNKFFQTLFVLNWANAGKMLVGVAAGVLTAAAFVTFPPAVLAASTIIVSVASVLGIHAVHLADKPEVPLAKR